MRYKTLSEVGSYVSEKINVSKLRLENYISTENMISNRGGISLATKLPSVKTTTAFQKGDILISNIRPSFKKIWLADKSGGCSNDVLVIRSDSNFSNRFLYYVLSSDTFFDYAVSTSKGTKMPRGDKSSIMKYTVPLFSLEEQELISDILKSYDEKIQLNKQINHHLEEIGTAIWQEKFRNKVPNGTLGDIASISNGKRPPVKAAEPTYEEKIPILGASSVMGYTNQTLYHQKILVTGRVGTHGIIQRYQDSCWPSDNTLVLQSNYYEFVYQILKNIDFTAMNRGSTQPLITQTDLKKNKIYIPAANELANFEIIVGTHMKQYERNNIENDILSNLRNTLLPKLLSGELSITQATK
ncbi:restriction endonuclease subunit S [Streptococcus equi]|uniref:restriction endonuclease subunit S n=4 Tax=Streptococcus equi TaxID=1336 RepID=UPI0024A7CE66|nr:restriction endonuclease subunit S [Streptococcus equi]MDI6089112.1 restriction endonuclease subunit S [Streptococcus equi subsp. zooepidemicus]